MGSRERLRLLADGLALPVDLILIFPFILIAALSRFSIRRIDVGLGPENLINNVYFKQALEQQGLKAETFVFHGNFITDDFDVNFHPSLPLLFFLPYYFYLKILFTYRFLFIYFNGGPLGRKPVLRFIEPILYKLAGIKTVVLAYGSDVQIMQKSPNLLFKAAMTVDYPWVCKNGKRIAQNIERWTRHADWIISGCEWVDYMTYWDTLTLGHFCINTRRWDSSGFPKPANTFKILHAPNHPNAKGTPFLREAVEQLQKKGLDIELIILSGVPNSKIHEAMAEADLVADQFVIGWYAFFAIEAMAMKKPVLCYLRFDLLELYETAGLIEQNEMPILNTPIDRISERIEWAYNHRKELIQIGEKGRTFVLKHHDLDPVGKMFVRIMNDIERRG